MVRQQVEHDPKIIITPPICATDGAMSDLNRHSQGDVQRVPLPMADRTQYNFWEVINGVVDDLDILVNSSEVGAWPEDLLSTAAACLTMADAALREWRKGNWAECLVISRAAHQSVARFRAMIEAVP